MYICTKCGEQINEDYIGCPKCGLNTGLNTGKTINDTIVVEETVCEKCLSLWNPIWELGVLKPKCIVCGNTTMAIKAKGHYICSKCTQPWKPDSNSLCSFCGHFARSFNSYEPKPENIMMNSKWLPDVWRRFELIGKGPNGISHNKFWEIVYGKMAGSESFAGFTTVKFGKIGKTPLSQTKTFTNIDYAKKSATSNINSKLKKGYIEVDITGYYKKIINFITSGKYGTFYLNKPRMWANLNENSKHYRFLYFQLINVVLQKFSCLYCDQINHTTEEIDLETLESRLDGCLSHIEYPITEKDWGRTDWTTSISYYCPIFGTFYVGQPRLWGNAKDEDCYYHRFLYIMYNGKSFDVKYCNPSIVDIDLKSISIVEVQKQLKGAINTDGHKEYKIDPKDWGRADWTLAKLVEKHNYILTNPPKINPSKIIVTDTKIKSNKPIIIDEFDVELDITI